MSQSAAIFLASASSSFFSPLRKRTFSHSTAEPGSTCTPSIQSFTRGTFTPRRAVRRSATGARDSSGSYSPSLGRPRWDTSMTRAPALRACWMVGRAARMRASLVTFPSATGTFRSSRISTRFPFSSRSVILSMFTPAILAELYVSAMKRLLGVPERDRGIEHAVAEAPLVVVPAEYLHQTADDLGQCGVVGAGSRIVVVVHGHELFLGVVQHALERAIGR